MPMWQPGMCLSGITKKPVFVFGIEARLFQQCLFPEPLLQLVFFAPANPKPAHMKLTLSNSTSIGELKKSFAACFPYLELAFYRHSHRQRESSMLDQQLPEHTLLSEIEGVRGGVFTFEPAMPVADFEERLQSVFGLPVQVLRKAGNNLWIETMQTDDLSLQKQNDMGEASCKPVRINLASLFL